MFTFIDDEDMNFRVLTTLGGVAFGCGDVGEVMTALSHVTPKDEPSWAAAFHAVAHRVELIAQTAAEHGQRRSAADAYLRAATYYACAQDAELTYADDATLLATFRSHRRTWDRFAELHEPTLERISIPCDGNVLPGYFLSVDGTPRPTVVIVNGSDGALTWVWTLAAAAHANGFNALLFDGPGQQSMLFEQHVPFRPDWESVITPVVDAIIDRPDVDADALVIYGGSQGGFWVPRALAFEHRFAAGIVDPGVLDVAQSWLRHLPKELVELLDAHDADAFNGAMSQVLKDPGFAATWKFRARPYGTFEPYALFEQMRAYDIRDVAGQIRTPLFIADPDHEQFWPGQSAELASLVGDRAHLSRFLVSEGAQSHCEPVARTLLYQRAFDWLATQLG